MADAATGDTPTDRLYALIHDGLAMGNPASSLTVGEWCVLLRVQQDVFPGEIVKSTHLSQPHVSRTLRKLERMGLVERSLAPSDSRRTIIRITPAGSERIAQVNALAILHTKSARRRYLR